jgi:radical SAM protein with 4Fe4S-binding SPASM domain
MTGNNIRFKFDAIEFLWRDVPREKYENFMKMRNIEASPDCYSVDGYPYMLQLEPTNRCNLKCPLCPAGTGQLGRPRRDMPLEEFQSLVDDMERYLLFIVLWEWGEPFMHPQLPEMIRYAADRGIQSVTSTNAHFLHDEEYLRRILNSGLATLIVAIDSLEQERYAVYRQNGSLSKAMQGLQTLVRLKKETGSKTRINLRMVIMKQNEHELPAMRRFAKSSGVDIFSVKSLNPSCGLDAKDIDLVPRNPAYRRYVYDEASFERTRVDCHCRKMTFMCSISANGEVIPCGYDFSSELKVGNIAETPLSEIWNSPASQEMRRRLYYEKESIPKCAECSINFKLSKGGWIPEVIVFDVDRWSQLFKKTYAGCVQHSKLKRCVDAMPAVKKVARRLRNRFFDTEWQR